MPTDKELLIKDLMHKCDCLYRENSRLKEKMCIRDSERTGTSAFSVDETFTDKVEYSTEKPVRQITRCV